LFHWAQRNAEHIVPLYCFDPRHYVGTYNFNLPKTGPFRLRFLLESVRDLRNTLLNTGRLPDVYTEFRKAVESQSRVRPVLPTPERLNPLPPGLDEGAIPTAEDLQQTGVPFVDANMRELALTGFMSNRGRQNVASFLTKDLGLDWRQGAEWFEYLLGEYVRRWVPELGGIRGADVHTPWNLSSAALSHAGVSLGDTYPTPVVTAPEWSRHFSKKPVSDSVKREVGAKVTPV
ncbi:hypothetical protein GOODEAATRI_026486, partial [Goodea atripinnis]